ncbi:Acetolactate synthase [Cytospora mali]|uniref:Acetolactate synthase n=1 Tax=Cytospora mali TaxID=578113 RepID=A0A194VBW7_CYTMA|nr:Acetolactate synthase [Valsa mali var. pyri (nom. inval.)]
MATEIETVDIVTQSLLNAGVKYILGVPGAKIDSVFNALVDTPEIKLIVCRHEQNAVFIAGAIGKITGTPGVCIATSGPGTSNLVTGLVTANDEGSPVVAIVGSVKRALAAKRVHQSLQAVDLLKPVTKKVTEAVVEDQVAEIMLDAFRVAAASPQGATVVSLPMDVMTAGHRSSVLAAPPRAFTPPEYGPSSASSLAEAAKLIEKAKFPVLFLGMRGADHKVVEAVHNFLRKHPIPVIETFQAAGAISEELVHLFYGRVGLFRNQPGDKMVQHSDLVITVGYDQAEYESSQWNTRGHSLPIIHMDTTQALISESYNPRLELIGSMADNIAALTDKITEVARPQDTETGKKIYKTFHEWETSPKALGNIDPDGPVHPLHFIRALQAMIIPKTTVTCDVGSHYIWMSRYFSSYNPKTFLVSNAQQTLGVALPWAIGASLVHGPSEKIVSVSGDGGFLFSSQELATAVQQGCNITHFIWNDEKYNMVEFQEVAKYGRSAGVDLGGVDFVKYAEAFGAKGVRVSSSSELEQVMKESLAYEGVCVVDIVIDYRDNLDLMSKVLEDSIC